LTTDINKHESLQKIVTEAYDKTIVCDGIIDGSCDTNWNSEYALFYGKQIDSKPHVTRLLFSSKNSTGIGDKGVKAGFVNIQPFITDDSEVAETYICPPDGFFVRDATIKTEYMFAYVVDKKGGIYQPAKNVNHPIINNEIDKTP